MTKEQLDKANALVKRIEHLRKILDEFRSVANRMDSSLIRMTDFYIIGGTKLSGNDFRENINQGELMFLVEAFENEIQRLEI